MESQRLDESWCVVVVVTPESVQMTPIVLFAQRHVAFVL